MILDAGIHLRLGKARFVAFVMAETPVADHVDDHIIFEFLTKLGGQLGDEHHRFRVVPVDVKDRRLDNFGAVRGIRRRSGMVGMGGKADLVVDNKMNRPAGAVAFEAGQHKTFRDNPLAGKGGVAVDQKRENLASFSIPALGLLGPGFAQHDRVHRFQVRGIGGQRQMYRIAVKLAVG